MFDKIADNYEPFDLTLNIQTTKYWYVLPFEVLQNYILLFKNQNECAQAKIIP